ncbi:MAG: insulinase family protein [Kiritimatiellae bacterium]|nr:insulinase family protein [Kiritimatiellia bacterium]
MDVESTKLDNGVRVITASLPYMESVTLGMWTGVGSRYEQKKTAGASHFIEHLLFKGTEKRTAKDISQAIEGRGGYLNAFTQEENTCYYARVAHEQTWNALDVLTDMFLNSRFDSVEIEKERGVIIEEIMMYRDQPHHEVSDMLTNALWSDHPLGASILGTPESIQGMTRDTIVDFMARKYSPKRTLLAFAGKIDHERCVAKVEEMLSSWKGNRPPVYKTAASSVSQDRVSIKQMDIEQVHLALGIRIFGRQNERRYALRVLNAVLGENMSSRLFQTVREKYGLAYSVHSSCHLFHDSGALVISAGLDKKCYLKALELIIKELARLKEKPIGARELKRGKDYVMGQIKLGLESTTNQMIWIGDNIMSYGKFMHPSQTLESLTGVTSEDVQKLAGSILKRSRISLALITPKASADDERRIRPILKSL